MNDDLISRSTAKEIAAWYGATEDFDSLIDQIPAVDAEPVRHGRWELVHKELSECSACGMIRNIRTQFAWTYCPNCGAKMDAEG